jgi:hypothetical protein
MPRGIFNTLTSYKVNKNLTVEAREYNGKNTLFVNGKVYVFDKIEEGNFFFSKEEKNIRNILVDNIENTNISFYLEGKRPVLIKCDFNADVDNGLGRIINKLHTFYLDQYDIETFAGLPTQKNIRRLITDYKAYIYQYWYEHGSFVDICCRAALIYIDKNIDLSLRDIPSVPSKNPKSPDGACSVEEQDTYIKDILAKATNDLEKQLFSIVARMVILGLTSSRSNKLKTIELARDEFIKNELAKGEALETIFTNLIADMKDFTSKALQSEQFKHLKYRDIRHVFCSMRNNGSVEFYDTFKAEDLCSEPDLLFKSIEKYLDKIKDVRGIIQNIIDKHIQSDVSVEKCRNIINENVNHLQVMFEGIQYLIDIGCKLNNEDHTCLRHILYIAECSRGCYKQYEEYCDSKLVFVECNVEPFKIVEHYAIDKKIHQTDRTDITKKLAWHLLEFLLKKKIINPDNGEEISDSYNKKNDFRMFFMQSMSSGDITEHTIQFLTILGKYGFGLKQEHLDVLQNTIALVNKDVAENKDKVSKYMHLTYLELSRYPKDIITMCHAYSSGVAYLKNANPFLEFVKNNIR